MTLNQRIALAVIVAKLLLDTPGIDLESLNLNEAQPFIRFVAGGQEFAAFLQQENGDVSFRFGTINGGSRDENTPAARFLDMLAETRSKELANRLFDLLAETGG